MQWISLALVVGVTMAAGAIFVSYRRQDAPGYAGRIYDALAGRFGDGRVFMDIDGIEPGADFAQRIDDAVGSCDVLLAVIGPEWTTVTDPAGERRLDQPDDFIALEVGTALRRPDVKVIPVLVDGAQMPTQRELPSALAPLARRQAIELSAARWRYDADTLLAVLERVLPTEEARPIKRERRAEWSGSQLVLVAVVATLVAVGPAYEAYKAGLHLPKHPLALEIARFATAWAGFWAVLALVIGLAVAAVERPARSVVWRGLVALSTGFVAGALGGAVDGALRHQYPHHVGPGIVAGFALTGAVFGLAGILTRASLATIAGGLLAGALTGWLVAKIGARGFVSQALPAAVIVIGVAAAAVARGAPVQGRAGVPTRRAPALSPNLYLGDPP